MALHTEKDTMDAKAFTEANRTYFNDLASKYTEKPWQQKLIAQIRTDIRNKLDFIGVDWAHQGSNDGEKVRLLDYACGTGAISTALRPYITSTTGIDISSGMVTAFLEQLSSNGEDEKQLDSANAYVGDLLADPSETASKQSDSGSQNFETPEFYDFDIVAVGAALHHFADPEAAVRGLGRRLKKGGVLLIIDFIGGGVTHGHGHGHGHGHHHHHSDHHEKTNTHHHHHSDEAWPDTDSSHTISQHGFSQEGMQKLFEAAADDAKGSDRVIFDDFGWSVMDGVAEIVLPKKSEESGQPGEEVTYKRKVFLARATRRQ